MVNLLLISLDSLTAGHLNCYGHRHQTSPNLDALAAEGVLAERCYCPVVPTGPIHTTLFSGQHPLTHQVVHHGGPLAPPAGTPWLPSLLQAAGWTTAAVDNLRGIKPWFGDGFEYYLDPSHRHGHTWSVPMALLNTRAVPWLEQHASDAEPWFLFIHAWDPHTPYLPPKRLREQFYTGDDPCDPANDSLRPFRRQYFADWFRHWIEELGEDLGPGRRITDRAYIEAMYDAEIRYLDEQLGVLLNALDATGTADDTLVVVVGDHGEMMGENDVYFDHHSLYEANIHVPLLARWPAGGVAGGRRLGPLCQHTDLAVTCLAAAGLPVPEAMEGSDLLPLWRGEPSATEPPAVLYTCECSWQAGYAIRTDRYKLLLARGPGLHNQPPRELYDLANDPGETTNLYLDQWPLAQALEEQFNQWLADAMARGGWEQDPIRPENLTLGRRALAWAGEQGR